MESREKGGLNGVKERRKSGMEGRRTEVEEVEREGQGEGAGRKRKGS